MGNRYSSRKLSLLVQNHIWAAQSLVTCIHVNGPARVDIYSDSCLQGEICSCRQTCWKVGEKKKKHRATPTHRDTLNCRVSKKESNMHIPLCHCLFPYYPFRTSGIPLVSPNSQRRDRNQWKGLGKLLRLLRVSLLWFQGTPRYISTPIFPASPIRWHPVSFSNPCSPTPPD